MRFLKPTLFVVIMFLTAFVGGCGSDDDNPTSLPPANADIAGLWTGTGKIQSIEPVNHPLTQTLLPAIGMSSPATLSIQKNGQNLTARLTSTETGIFTDYTGTFSSNSFTLNATSSSVAVITGIVCGDGVSRDMQASTDAITGTISGNNFTATEDETYNCIITETQAPDGIISVKATLSFKKSK